MIYLYRLLTYLVYGVTYPYGRIKAFQGDRLWQGRLAEATYPPVDIWLHAASVGEVRVISHLMDFLQKANPALRLHLTVMTRTGFETARAVCGKNVAVSFLPFDVPLLWRRMIHQLQPKAVVVAETEIWPNLIVRLKAARIPLILVNGRLSERAFERYRALRASFLPLLESYDHFFVKGADDLARFVELGVPNDKMTMNGDMKFDAPLLERSNVQRAQVRSSFGIDPSDIMLVAGSTREGEETIILDCYRTLRADFPRLRLVLVPRHIERAGQIRTLIEQAAYEPYVVSESAVPSTGAVVLVDRMGVLNDCYAAADIAFVGGTLVEIGGHNVLEPVWAGTPVIFGPSVSNVRDAAEYIASHNYGAVVRTSDELIQMVRDVIGGTRTFARKTRTDLEQSSTARAGKYILSRIQHA